MCFLVTTYIQVLWPPQWNIIQYLLKAMLKGRFRDLTVTVTGAPNWDLYINFYIALELYVELYVIVLNYKIGRLTSDVWKKWSSFPTARTNVTRNTQHKGKLCLANSFYHIDMLLRKKGASTHKLLGSFLVHYSATGHKLPKSSWSLLLIINSISFLWHMKLIFYMCIETNLPNKSYNVTTLDKYCLIW